MASPQPPLPENKLSVAILKSIPLSIGCLKAFPFQLAAILKQYSKKYAQEEVVATLK